MSTNEQEERDKNKTTRQQDNKTTRQQEPPNGTHLRPVEDASLDVLAVQAEEGGVDGRHVHSALLQRVPRGKGRKGGAPRGSVER